MSEDLPEEDRHFLRTIQHKLFTVGSYLATNQESRELMVESRVHPETIERVEQEIDCLDNAIPKMTAFILPGVAVLPLWHMFAVRYAGEPNVIYTA